METLKYYLKEHPGLGKYKGQRVIIAQPAHAGMVSFEKLCKELAKGSTVEIADAEAVLTKLTEVISDFTAMGYSVDCGKLGIFKPSFSSKSVLTEKEFTTELIKPAKIIFRMRTPFRDSIRSLGFERVKTPAKEEKKGGKKDAGAGIKPNAGAGDDPTGKDPNINGV